MTLHSLRPTSNRQPVAASRDSAQPRHPRHAKVPIRVENQAVARSTMSSPWSREAARVAAIRVGTLWTRAPRLPSQSTPQAPGAGSPNQIAPTT